MKFSSALVLHRSNKELQRRMLVAETKYHAEDETDKHTYNSENSDCYAQMRGFVAEAICPEVQSSIFAHYGSRALLHVCGIKGIANIIIDNAYSLTQGVGMQVSELECHIRIARRQRLSECFCYLAIPRDRAPAID